MMTNFELISQISSRTNPQTGERYWVFAEKTTGRAFGRRRYPSEDAAREAYRAAIVSEQEASARFLANIPDSLRRLATTE